MFSVVSDFIDGIKDQITDSIKDTVNQNDSSGSDAKPAAGSSSSTKFLAGFYGLGGAGGFHQDWLENIANKAGAKTKSAVRFYDHDEGQEALADLFSAIDINDDSVISGSEVRKIKVRAVGYSLGGIAAVNFTRQLNRVGEEVAGYRLDTAVPVRRLVTIDPVNNDAPLPHTDGPLENVRKFTNYYQRRGGDTSIDVLERRTKIRLTTLSFDDPTNIIGDRVDSAAQRTKQIRIDTGSWGRKRITHDLESGTLGRMRGRDVNHGTITWFVYNPAVEQLR